MTGRMRGIWSSLVVALVAAGCIDAVRERPSPIHPSAFAPVSFATPDPRPRGPAAPVQLVREQAERRGYEVYAFRMPSSGENGQPGNQVAGRYFKRATPARTPTVIIVPIYGSSAYPSRTMARFLARSDRRVDMNVLLIEAQGDLADWPRLGRAGTEKEFLEAMAEATAHYRTTAEDVSRVIDWAVTRPEVDPGRIGIVGFSLSATIAALVMTGDSRPLAGAFLMGGADLHEVFAFCQESQVARAREAVMARFGWSEDVFKARIRPVLDTINPALRPGVNGGRRTLVVEAVKDDYLPKRSRDALREAVGASEHIRLGYGHQVAFVKGMTVLGFHYLERAVVRFFEDAFATPLDPGRPLPLPGGPGLSAGLPPAVCSLPCASPPGTSTR